MRLAVTVGLLLAFVSFSVYFQVGSHDFLTLDDRGYVVINPHVSTGISIDNMLWAFTSISEANWHPITWMSHMLDVQMFGMEPRGHHLVSVFIHIATSLLLFWLLVRLTHAVWRSAFVAALFALHPLHVESVAWVAERKDVLSAFFWVLTLYVYAEYVKKGSFLLYLLSILAFVLGIMSKPMLVTLPVIMLFFDVWPLDRYAKVGKSSKKQSMVDLLLLQRFLKEKIPFFAITFFSCAMTIYAQNKGGAIKSTDVVSLWARIENASTTYIKYIIKMLWPADLAIYYRFPVATPHWQFNGSLLLLFAASIAVIVAAKPRPYLLTGWFWFFVTLVPVIGLIQVGGQGMADRYTYIPLIGLFLAVAWGVPDLVGELPQRKVLLASLAMIVVSAATLLTWRQLGHWRDSITLYRHTLRVTSGSVMIYNHLGIALAEHGLYDEAIAEYRNALRLNPYYVEARNNLGFAFMRKGSLDLATREFFRALEINPYHVRARNNLGRVLAAQGYYDEAIGQLKKAIEINPGYLPAQESLRLVMQFRDAELAEDRMRRSRPTQ